MEPTLKIDDRVLVIKDTIVELDITSGDIVVFYNNDSGQSISFFEEICLDYVSASPFRVPIARLAAAQAELLK